jgi:hypothetical protein
MFSYSSVLLGPAYRLQGVPVTLTVGATIYPAPDAPPLRMLDKTAGLSLPGVPQVETIEPAAVARVADIIALGLTLSQLDQTSLNMNEKDWLISSFKPMPSPKGENDGEVYLYLQAI